MLDLFGRGGGIRTRDIQLPKLALYQAELRPGARKVAVLLANGNLDGRSKASRNRPFVAELSRNPPERLITRERLAELTALLDRRIATRIVSGTAR